MADQQRSRDVFPFFDLPLELREMIYDESFEKRKGRLHGKGLRYEASGMPVSNLLLVSKQVGHEYNVRSEKQQRLRLTDDYPASCEDDCKLPGPAAWTSVTLIISIRSRSWDQIIEYYEGWLPTFFAAMPHQTPLQLDVKVHSDGFASIPAYRQRIEEFISLINANTDFAFTTCVQGTQRVSNGDWGLWKAASPLLMWSPESQKLEDIS